VHKNRFLWYTSFDMGTLKTFSLLGLALLTLPVSAQSSKSTKPTTASQSTLEKTLEKELKLSEAQKKKWSEINGRYRPKIKAVRDKFTPEQERLQKQLKALTTKMAAELKPTLDARRKELDQVLTPEQKKKKEALNAALRAAIQRRLSGGNRRP
jgi:gas vesicle protein